MTLEELRRKRHKRYVKWLWLFIYMPFIGIGVLLLIARMSDLPTFEQLENPNSNLATQIFSSDGEVLGKYYSENRTNVDFEDLPSDLINALVATEDERYYEHSGVDWYGLGRAVAFMGRRGGASTISQQLAKMLFTKRSKNFVERILQKAKEWIIASRLERTYMKSEIIAMYYNMFDFTNQGVGINSASKVYFNKKPDELNLQEAALFAGMAKNPSYYRPVRHRKLAEGEYIDRCYKRREVVLKQMQKNQYITQEVYDSVRVLPIEVDFQVSSHNEGMATHFREVMRKKVTEILKRQTEDGEQYMYGKGFEKTEAYDIYDDGLKIYTTIDTRMQEYAKYAVKEHLSKQLQKDFDNDLKNRKNYPYDWKIKEDKRKLLMNSAKKQSDYYKILKKQGLSEDSINVIFDTPKNMKVFSWDGEIDTIFSPNDSIRYHKAILNSGLVSIDPKTGFVKAWVGGINFKYYKYDHVKQAKRQVGSTFKPFVYTAGIMAGYLPCHKIDNIEYCVEVDGQKPWCPKNSGGSKDSIVSLKTGLALSMNNATAWIMKQVKPKAVADLASKMGIKTEYDVVPSIALGTPDLSLFEMVGAYGTLANKGIHVEPIYILRIEDKNGNTIYSATPEMNEAIDESTAYITLNLMKGVCNYGTGARIRSGADYGKISYPIAGKTGTTQNNTDGWFIGITPDLVTGVWVGSEDAGVRFSKTYYGQGANTALPIWGYYMNKVYKDDKIQISTKDFEKPLDGDLGIELDCSKSEEGEENWDDVWSGGNDPEFG